MSAPDVTTQPSLETRIERLEAFAAFIASRLGIVVNLETGEWKLTPEAENTLGIGNPV